MTPRAIFAQARRLATKLGAPGTALLHLRGDSEVRVSVETHGDAYAWVLTERGQEVERRVTRDLDELLFWLIGSVIFEMATAHELANRIAGQDFRRVLFAKEVELFERLDPRWAARAVERINDTLARHPFMDDLEPRFLVVPEAGQRG